MKVRQELTGNANMTKTESDQSSLQDVPRINISETQDENPTIQIAEKVNNELTTVRGRKRSEFLVNITKK